MKHRIIKVKGEPHQVIISYAEYLEYLDLKGKSGKNQPNVSKVPEEVARRLRKGESPLKAWRLYRDLTQTELANLAGVSASAISMIENSIRPGTIETFRALARALKIPIAALVGSRGWKG